MGMKNAFKMPKCPIKTVVDKRNDELSGGGEKVLEVADFTSVLETV